MILNTHPENRKEMVKAICELTGMNAMYLFTPTYAYQVGPITVSRDGSIDCEDEAMIEVIKPMLIERGWLEAEETPEAPDDSKEMPEAVDDINAERMDITMPIPGWTVAQMTNLLRMLYSKQVLIKGPAHKEENLPKTQEELLAFLHGLECPPSIIVHSGNGLHTYWLLQEYTAVNDENRESIRRIVKGHELHTQKLGRAYGWKFDSVADLARVLRIPGTLNHKSDPPRQVEIIEANLARYPLSAFAEYADEAAEYTGERIHFAPAPDRVGPAQRIIDGCAFVRHCWDDAENLSEPYWYAMITNVAPASDGTEAVHTKPHS